MNEILNIIHKTIYQFFDTCEDDEEVPMSDKDKLLLEVNKAICNNLKALEKEQNLQPTCNQLATDCISRQAAIDILDDLACDYESGKWNNSHSEARGRMINLPSVEPEGKIGKWIRGKSWSVGIGMDEQYGYFYKCSECGKEVKGGYTKCTDRFCKSCGAKMEV